MGFSLLPGFRIIPPAPRRLPRSLSRKIYAYDDIPNHLKTRINPINSPGSPLYDDSQFPTKAETTPRPPFVDFRVHYYGFRYYSPELGRWPSRDPLGDEVFLKQYASDVNISRASISSSESRSGNYLFINNDSINKIDLFGLHTLNNKCDNWTIEFSATLALVYSGGVVVSNAFVRADPDCCMDNHAMVLTYTGAAIGFGSPISISGSDNVPISTALVGWDWFEGWGRLTSAGIGLFFGISDVYYTLPNIQFRRTGTVSGNPFNGDALLDASLMTSIGYWSVEEPYRSAYTQ